MNETEATDILGRIKGTWKIASTDRVWMEELEPLDFNAALATYLKLRRELKSAPAISTFMDEYVLHVPEPAAEPTCEFCDSTGFVIVTPPDYHHPGCPRPPAVPMVSGPNSLIPDRHGVPTRWLKYPCDCHAALPCRDCKRGRDAHKVHRSVLAFNVKHSTAPVEPRPEQQSLAPQEQF